MDPRQWGWGVQATWPQSWRSCRNGDDKAVPAGSANLDAVFLRKQESGVILWFASAGRQGGSPVSARPVSALTPCPSGPRADTEPRPPWAAEQHCLNRTVFSTRWAPQCCHLCCRLMATQSGSDLGEELVAPHTTTLIKDQLHLIFETQRARQLTCCMVVTQLSSVPVTVTDVR